MTHTISRSTAASRIAGIVALAGIAILVAAPYWASSATLHLIGEFAVYVALATLWNLLAGYTGLVSVGQQAYVGLGGYLLFSLALFLGIPPLAAIPLAGLGAVIIAIPVAALVFRLQGAYFAIGTWVIAETFRLIVAQATVLGGGSGISLPATVTKQLGAKSVREASIYWAALALGVGCLALVYLLLRSRIGLALTAIRDSEIASASLGIRIERVKYAIYIVVAGVTAMIGALISLQKLRVSPDASFSVNDWTAFVIFIVVIGGIGTIEGPIIGTIIYFLLREFLADYGSIYLLFLGALAIVVMLAAPKGIWGFATQRFGWSLFPVGYRITFKD
ncbi:MAG: branched-chain amino acid ABC transporter permease [Paracoccaceae bacterium]